jgi:hypothetical protein
MIPILESAKQEILKVSDHIENLVIEHKNSIPEHDKVNLDNLCKD